MKPQYKEDFYGWTKATAALLKDKKFDELDIDNLIEEIESMGARDYRELINRLSLLVCHLLKWCYQPGYQGKSWKDTISEQRDEIKLVLDDSPSFYAKESEFFPKAYKRGKRKAASETGLSESTFPVECPYTLEQCLDDEFYPGNIQN